MDKQLDLTEEKTEVIAQIGDALAAFLTIAMRDLSKEARAEMNRQLEAGTGYHRLTTEFSASGLRVAAAFVAEQNNIIPITEIFISNTENDLGEDAATPWTTH